MFRVFFSSLTIFLLGASWSLAAPAITCHCFTDRSFDPSRPNLADPYFLATAQNSFFSALFKVDKKVIVMKKQAGSSADDLWVAYWIASRSGTSAEVLLSAREKMSSWQEVAKSQGIPAKLLGERVAGEMAGGALAGRLARIIVDDALVRHRLLASQELEMMRKEFASNQEVIITSLIALKTKRPALQVYRGVKKGMTSWGTLLNETQTQPAVLQAEFAALLR